MVALCLVLLSATHVWRCFEKLDASPSGPRKASPKLARADRGTTFPRHDPSGRTPQRLFEGGSNPGVREARLAIFSATISAEFQLEYHSSAAAGTVGRNTWFRANGCVAPVGWGTWRESSHLELRSAKGEEKRESLAQWVISRGLYRGFFLLILPIPTNEKRFLANPFLLSITVLPRRPRPARKPQNPWTGERGRFGQRVHKKEHAPHFDYWYRSTDFLSLGQMAFALAQALRSKGWWRGGCYTKRRQRRNYQEENTWWRILEGSGPPQNKT